MKPKFNTGQILATPGALEALEDSGQNPGDFLSRHVKGDWGEVLRRGQRVERPIPYRWQPPSFRIPNAQWNEALDHHGSH